MLWAMVNIAWLATHMDVNCSSFDKDGGSIVFSILDAFWLLLVDIFIIFPMSNSLLIALLKDLLEDKCIIISLLLLAVTNLH